MISLSVLLMCTTGGDIAGSKGGSETTNGISASIHHDDGTPAAFVADSSISWKNGPASTPTIRARS
jgi:hypothetical protein